MARHDQTYRIVPDRAPDRLRGHRNPTALPGDPSGDLPVRRRFPIRNLQQYRPDRHPKTGTPQAKRRRKIRPPPRKIKIHPLHCRLKYRQPGKLMTGKLFRRKMRLPFKPQPRKPDSVRRHRHPAQRRIVRIDILHYSTTQPTRYFPTFGIRRKPTQSAAVNTNETTAANTISTGEDQMPNTPSAPMPNRFRNQEDTPERINR